MYRSFLGGLCLLLTLLPVIYLDNLRFIYNEKRIIVSISLIISGILVLFISREKLKRIVSFLPDYFWWGALLFLLISGISAFKSSLTFYSIVEISLFLLLVWTALITAYVTQNHNFGKYAVIVSACFVALFYTIKFGLGYTFYLMEFKDFPLWPASGLKTGTIGFANIRFFNQVQVFTLPLLLGGGLLAIKKGKNVGFFLITLSAIWWMLLIQSAGRGIMLSVLTAALVILYLFKENTHRWMWYFLGTLLIGYVTKVLLFDIVPVDSGFSKSIVRGGSPRFTLYPRTFLASLNHPIIGHGPMSFADMNVEFTPSHPHNSILQLLYELGYPATIMIIGVIFYGLKKWSKQTKEQFETVKEDLFEEGIIRISLTAALFGALLYSLLSGVIVMPLSQLWLALVFGTALGLYVKNDSTELSLESIKTYKVIGFKLLLLFASITLASVLIKDIPHLRENEERFVEKTDSQTFRPRFWQQGKIGVDQMSDIEEKLNAESNL